MEVATQCLSGGPRKLKRSPVSLPPSPLDAKLVETTRKDDRLTVLAFVKIPILIDVDLLNSEQLSEVEGFLSVTPSVHMTLNSGDTLRIAYNQHWVTDAKWEPFVYLGDTCHIMGHYLCEQLYEASRKRYGKVGSRCVCHCHFGIKEPHATISE